MPTYIIKLTDKAKQDYYLEWSTIVDAPVTPGMSLDDFKEYYKERHGADAFAKLPERLERVEVNGVSAFGYQSLKSLISCNRAGENEKHLSMSGIIKKYCHSQNNQQ